MLRTKWYSLSYKLWISYTKWRLTKAQHQILQSVYEYFKLNATWPKSRQLAIELRHLGNFYDLVRAIGTNIILSGDAHQKDSEARLTVEGVILCKGNEKDLEDFVRVVQLCVKRYLNNPSDAKISTDLIASELGVSDVQALKMTQLLQLAPGLKSGGTGSADGKWTFRIPHEVLRFEGINSISEYFPIQRKTRKRPTSVPFWRRIGSVPLHVGKFLKSIKGVITTIAALLTILYLLGYLDAVKNLVSRYLLRH